MSRTGLAGVLQGIAFFLIFGTALCADGLADQPHGFTIMFLCVGVAGLLVTISNRLEAKENRPQYRNYRGRRGQRRR